MRCTRELDLLEELIHDDGTQRTRRLPRYLASELVDPPFSLPTSQWVDWCSRWAFHVPPTMATALDIQLTQKSWTEEIRDEHGKIIPLLNEDGTRALTASGKPKFKKITHKTLVWTQGSAFDFHPGYVIYDSSEAYSLPWGTGIKTIQTALQVIAASPAEPVSVNNPTRKPGFVIATLLRPNVERSELVEVKTFTFTQDEFVRTLIAGF